MSEPITSRSQGQPTPVSIDLWKFFEERGSRLKESMFAVVTWLIGLAAAVLGFAVKEGFAKGSALTSITHPASLIGLGVAGLLITRYGDVVIRDYGDHINRTFDRADAARTGETSPQRIWEAGQRPEGATLPAICQPLSRVVGLFSIAFAALIVFGTLAIIVEWAHVR